MMNSLIIKRFTYTIVGFVFLFVYINPVYAQQMNESDIRSIFTESTLYEDNTCSSPDDPVATVGTDSSVQEMAKQMLQNSNISYWTNNGVNTRDVVVALSEGKKAYTTAPDGQPETADINPNILKFILEVAEKDKIMVNALTDKDHSTTSNHYKGLAVDIDVGNSAPLSILNPIAEKYGGVKNSETTHHHFDFLERPPETGNNIPPSNIKYEAKGNIPIEGKTVGASIYGGTYRGGKFIPTNKNQDPEGKNGASDDPGIGNRDNVLAGTASYAELSTGGGSFNALGNLPNGTKLEITYKNKTVIAEKGDVGGGGGDVKGKTRAIDLWWELAEVMDFKDGLDLVKVRGVADDTPLTNLKDGATTASTESGLGSTNGCTCSENVAAGSGSDIVENISAFSPDPAMEKMFKDIGLPKMRQFIPLYQKAAQEEGMPFNWELLAGLHWTESDLSRKWTGNGVATVTGPFQQMTSELSQHLDDEKYKDLKTLVAPGGGLIGDGKEVNDKEFIVLARLALARWVKQALGDDYEKLKSAPIPFKETVDSNNVFWKIMGRWNPGAEGYQGFTGYNNTNYKAPQPITGYGAGDDWNKPGVATTYYLLKKNGISGNNTSGDCTQTVDEAGDLKEISGTKEELAQKILSYKGGKLRLGNYGNATTQESDIKNELKKETLIVLLAMLEQSGVTVPLNALRADHALRGAHGDGRAIDIGYYGNGNSDHKPDGDKLYKFLYRNRRALKIDQMIWQYPPKGYKCVYGGNPVDCNSAYPNDINDHYHHIHVGVRRG